ncbi:uncharacterized protein AAEQ78_004785 [Lycaon pictus]
MTMILEEDTGFPTATELDTIISISEGCITGAGGCVSDALVSYFAERLALKGGKVASLRARCQEAGILLAGLAAWSGAAGAGSRWGLGLGSRPPGLRSPGALWRPRWEGRDSAGAGPRAQLPRLFLPGAGGKGGAGRGGRRQEPQRFRKDVTLREVRTGSAIYWLTRPKWKKTEILQARQPQRSGFTPEPRSWEENSRLPPIGTGTANTRRAQPGQPGRGCLPSGRDRTAGCTSRKKNKRSNLHKQLFLLDSCSPSPPPPFTSLLDHFLYLWLPNLGDGWAGGAQGHLGEGAGPGRPRDSGDSTAGWF